MRRYLIVGQAGVGKSSFINTVLGIDAAKIDPFKSCTKVVEYHAQKTSLGNINLIDTPGLGEDTYDLDIDYLSRVREAIALHPIDVLLYITRLDDPRFRPSEKKALQLITQHIGPSVWQKSWLIQTFAAMVPEERFVETAKIRIEQISTFLQDLTASYEMENNRLFKHFSKILLIDNLNPSWNTYVPPTKAFRGFTWKRLSSRTIELVWKGEDQTDG